MDAQPCAAKDHEPIDTLAEEFLERYRRGERPAISEYVSKHPELASEIGELFPTLAVLERLGPRPEELSSRPFDATVGDVIPRQLGEYQLLREVGRGGMGIVYEAEQLSLGRRVALKVLPSHSVLPSSLLTRFQNEARAAARLHHTNIVPVFGVGEDQGIHYYAMQFIQGQGLDTVLEELRSLRRPGWPPDVIASRAPSHRSPPGAISQSSARNLLTRQFTADSAAAGHGIDRPVARQPSEVTSKSAKGDLSNHSSSGGAYFCSVARMGFQVAEALAHAHGQGVLHRDIKPSNLLLDAQSCVWVTDFGLAKQEGSDLTRSGDVVGTLRYLAPERFRGTSDARTDIYGLGVTLYELLTISPAFAATDRARLVHDIVEVDPVPPRRLAPHLPRDLETIVLKAMAKEPARRYPTAAEMAADLRRFLDDQPIGARRTWVVERAWRWCVRRPALAGLTVALLLSLVAGLGGVLWQWSRAETNLKEAVRQQGLAESSLSVARSETARAEQNLEEAGRQRTTAEREALRAEANYKMARQAVDGLLTMVSEDELKSQPGLQAMRLRLLTRALDYYQSMLAQRGDDPKARSELAASYSRVASIKRLTGPTHEARDNYDKAIALLESAIAEGHETTEEVLPLVNAYNELALVQIDDRDFEQAERGLGRARKLTEKAVIAEPESIRTQMALAMTLNNVAWCFSQSPERNHSGRLDEVLGLHWEALAIYRRLVEQQPDDYSLRRFISLTLSNMARRNLDARRFDAARPLFDETLKIRQELAKLQPDSLDMQSLLAATYKAIGDVVLRSPGTPEGWFEQAMASYVQALQMQERLVRENPAVVYYRHQMFLTLRNMGELFTRNKDFERALELRHRACDCAQRCLAYDSDGLNFHVAWAIALRERAEAEQQLGRDAEALATRYEAHETWRLIQQHPSVLEKRRNEALRHFTGLMRELGLQSRLADVYAIAIEQRELCAGRPRQLLDLSWELQRSIWAATRGVVLDDEGTAVAERCLDVSIAAFEEGARGAPDQLESFIRLRHGTRNYETLLKLDSDLDKNPDNVDMLWQRSLLLRQLGHQRRAMKDWDHAIELVEARLQKSPRNVTALGHRARLHFVADHWDETFTDATLVLTSRPNDIGMLRRRAIAAAHLGRWQQAQQDTAQILAQYPTDLFFLEQRCLASFELGQSDEVASDMRRLRDVIGQDGARANAAIWHSVESAAATRLPEEVLAFAQRAVELDRRIDPRIALGGIYCQLGRDREAVDTLELAGSSNTASPGVLREFWLAISWHRLGDHEKALQAYRRALRIWKLTVAMTASRQDFLEATWQEAKALLGDSESPQPRR